MKARETAPVINKGCLISFSFSDNLLPDCIKGCFVVACTLCAFISLVWLREQIVMNGGPVWLEPREEVVQANQLAENPGNVGNHIEVS